MKKETANSQVLYRKYRPQTFTDVIGEDHVVKVLENAIKLGNVSRKRHKKILTMCKGFRGAASVLFRTANQFNMKALRYSYNNRREKNGDSGRLWIARVNASVRR